jgi:hypothetical protein
MIDASVHVYGQENLDFLVCFQAPTVWESPTGTKLMASGCSYINSLSHRRVQEGRCPIKIIGWGHQQAGPSFRRLSSSAVEIIYAMEVLLSGPAVHIVVLDTPRSMRLEGMNQLESLTIVNEQFQSEILSLQLSNRGVPRPQLLLAQPEDSDTSGQEGILDSIQTALIQATAETLGIGAEDVDIHVPLEEYGFDLHTLQAMIRSINQKWQVELDLDTISLYQPLHRIAVYLMEKEETPSFISRANNFSTHDAPKEVQI